MKKAPEAFRTISEVSTLLDTPAHVLRFWESKFYQIKPIKRAGGRRYYRPDDVALLAGIRHLLVDEAQTIRGVQRLLQERGAKHVTAIGVQSGILSAVPGLNRAPVDALPADIAEIADDIEDAIPSTEGTDLAAEPGPAPVVAGPVATVQPAIPAPPLTISPPTAPTPAPPPTPALSVATGAAHVDMPLHAPRGGPDVSDPAQRPPERIAPRLRALPRGGLGARRDRLDMLARRIDMLLDRMSEASGAGRW
jgi:DNA-binding transcriptional MerR regulator